MKYVLILTKKITLFFVLFFSPTMSAVVVGSSLSVSLQPLINFPAADVDNAMFSFAWFKNGFTLQDATTTCTFDSVFPVSGLVSLNGGMMTLNQDLWFADITNLNTSGKIIGNGHFINYPTSITTFPSGNNIFQDCVVYINNDITLTSTLTFTGSSILNGNGHTINVGVGAIVVAAGSTLRATNVVFKEVEGSNIQCLDNASLLILDNVKWVQNGIYSFTQGMINFINEVDFQGDSIFAYQSTAISTMLEDTTWTLDTGFTFSYDPGTSPDLLQFNEDSLIVLNTNALLHATVQGLNLTKGTIFMAHNAAIGSEIWTDGVTTIDNGITVGDCANPANDFVWMVDGSVRFSILSGSWNYKNVNSNSLFLGDNSTSLFVASNSSLNSYQPMNMGNSITTFADNSTLGQAPSAPFTGNVATQGVFTQTTLADC